MLKSAWLWVILLSLCAPIRADDDHAKSADALEALLIETRQILPSEWQAEIVVSSADSVWGPDQDEIAIVIRTKEPVSVMRSYPNAPPRERPKEKKEPLIIRLTSRAFITPEKYRQAHEGNLEKTKRRLTFVSQRLQGIEHDDGLGKDHGPFGPGMYRPRNAKEKRAIVEYVFLWSQTQPEPLPTHFYRNLSFELTYSYESDYRRIVSKKTSAELRSILSKLEGIVKPYRGKDAH